MFEASGFRASALAALIVSAAALVACSGAEVDSTNYPEMQTRAQRRASQGSVLGGADGGMMLFGPGGLFGGDSKDAGGTGIGVNTYLWRASLDTLAFMPISSADPFGGVIISDWYSPPDNLADRFKVNVYILDRQLRADGVRASVFRQHREADGRWVDASVDPATQTDLENAILTRARQLRVSTAQR
jgi:hypothetical protein